MNRARPAILALSLCLSGKATAEQPSFTLAPYLWAPNVHGTVSLGNLAVPLSLPVRDLAKGFKAGALGYGSVDWHSAFLYAEGIYVRYGNDRFAPFFDEKVHASVTFGETGAGLHREIELGHQTIRISPYVGVRYIALHARISGTLISTTASNQLVDPIAGAIVELPVAPRVQLLAKVDGAGFGISHDRYVSASGLVEYRLNRRLAADVGYRYTHATLPSATDLGLSLRGHGPIVGLRYLIPSR